MKATESLNEIVKPMERGQITIPVSIREKLKITPQTWLWVKLVEKDKILIEPVEKKPSLSSLQDFLNKAVANSRSYWKSQDSLALNKVRKRSSERLKKLI